MHARKSLLASLKKIMKQKKGKIQPQMSALRSDNGPQGKLFILGVEVLSARDRFSFLLLLLLIFL